MTSVEFATALASIVFPVPGGPVMRIPFGGSMPNSLNASGLASGNSMHCLIRVICSSSPPISENVVSGRSNISAPDTNGSHALSRTSIIDKVS